MRKFWNTPIGRMMIAYLINSLVVTTLAFLMYQYTDRILLFHTNLWLFGNLLLFLRQIPQYLVYAVETAIVYFMVARPFHLRPLFEKADGARHATVVLLCILLVFAALFRFQAVFTVRNGIEMLTFMIVGLSEEWVFRGVMTRVLKHRVGMIWAVLIASTLFALSHWAVIGFADGKAPLTAYHFIALGTDFSFGVLLSIIVWRSRSILWGAFVHCVIDWKPSLRHWMFALHSPWFGADFIQMLLIGLIGAELIRFYGNRKTANVNRAETA
ncbi:CPBP family intramembrane glutamic endopeptidase [Alicyclobacillus sp. SO9]|uniref:CPBP family intramembrane glutamic endopeptidase n=1 Tax=Alicyclobacillus sp. SO9 TaxID=2665646 RepID=UPI0018E87F3A|nr:CPBP family intramembrane glutamic endopeptidase [Alicyclobacillus sp. SO9]QQE79169.1 CPBP family intramembrane metalloprotease [Alicyclobacillus sp. SO9]